MSTLRGASGLMRGILDGSGGLVGTGSTRRFLGGCIRSLVTTGPGLVVGGIDC
jgi:hypothetical protein